MLTFLSIKNFRLFQSLTIQGLKRVNLIAGQNNTGKSALLEALYLLFADDSQLVAFPSAFRSSQRNGSVQNVDGHQRDDFLNFWSWLIWQKELANAIEIHALDENRVDYSIRPEPTAQGVLAFKYYANETHQGTTVITSERITVGVNRPGWPRLSLFSTKPSYPSEDAEQFNRLALRKGAKKRLIELLQIVEPRLIDLQYLKIGNEALVYAELDLRELIPVTQLGQGFTRLLLIFSEMLISESDLVVIDEIENGLHHSVLREVWKGIATIAHQESIQVFATTHSWECIEAAHKVFASSDPSDFRLHRLEQIKGEIKAITYDDESIDAALRFEMEVR